MIENGTGECRKTWAATVAENGPCLLLSLIVLVVAFLVRWDIVPPDRGQEFSIVPDSMEYAATAHSIVQTGEFFLQVGPWRVPPRYSPGYPLFLSLFLRLGIPGEKLWRVNAIVGSLHAWLLFFIAYVVARMIIRKTGYGRDGPWSVEPVACLAGLIAGMGWAFSPISLNHGRHVMSDELGALSANIFLVFLSFLFYRQGKGAVRTTLPLSLLAGISYGCMIGVRPILGFLLAGSICILFLGCLVQCHKKVIVIQLLGMMGGVLLGVLPVIYILHRSGYPLTKWSHYEYWAPEYYDSIRKTFHPQYAIFGNEEYGYKASERILGHAEVALRLFTGWGRLPEPGIGRWWPFLSILCFLVIVRRLLSGVTWKKDKIPWLLASYFMYFSATLLAFSLYFFPAIRFYLPVLPFMWLPISIAIAFCWFQTRRALKYLGYALLLLLACFSYLELRPLVRSRPSYAYYQSLRSIYDGWNKTPEIQKAMTVLPFDPIMAQAYGILPLSAVPDQQIWGKSPDTSHFIRLKMNHSLSQRPAVPLIPYLDKNVLLTKGFSLQEILAGGEKYAAIQSEMTASFSLTIRMERRYLAFGYSLQANPVLRSSDVRLTVEVECNREKHTIFQTSASVPQTFQGENREYRLLDLTRFEGQIITLIFSSENQGQEKGVSTLWLSPILTD